MNKTILRRTFAVLFFVLLSVSSLAIFNVKAESRTITVPDDYSTIQEAINNAVDGDKVFVKSGIYTESLIINKKIILEGENKFTTIVKGEGTTALLIKHDNVKVNGFTFKRTSTMRWYYGIHLLDIENCNIFDNIVTNTFNGIWIVNSHQNNIENNIVYKNWHGIVLKESNLNIIQNNQVISNVEKGIRLANSQENSITMNYLRSNGYSGISLERTSSSPGNSDNEIEGNLVEKNGNFGIKIEYGSSNNIVLGNNVSSNGSGGYDAGIYVGYRRNKITENIISNNYIGIQLDDENSKFFRNTIENNRLGGVCDHNRVYKHAFYENNFVGDLVVFDRKSECVWGFNSKGNYWSDYNGTDYDDDGLGETIYRIDDKNIDRRPLMVPVRFVFDIPDFVPFVLPSPTPSPQPTVSFEPSDVEFPVLIVASIIIIVLGSIGILTIGVRTKRRS